MSEITVFPARKIVTMDPGPPTASVMKRQARWRADNTYRSGAGANRLQSGPRQFKNESAS